jgi:hypothetical protein
MTNPIDNIPSDHDLAYLFINLFILQLIILIKTLNFMLFQFQSTTRLNNGCNKLCVFFSLINCITRIFYNRFVGHSTR